MKIIKRVLFVLFIMSFSIISLGSNHMTQHSISNNPQVTLSEIAFGPQKSNTSNYFQGLIEPTNRSKEEMEQEVLAFYYKWKAKYLKEVKDITPVQKYLFYNESGYFGSAVTCSEAHGYGMLATVLLADFDPQAKDDYDALYRYYKAHPSVIQPTNMAWQQVELNGKIIDNPQGGNDSATDGDMDIAYSLLLAHNRWGSFGEINYYQEAISCIQGLMDSVVNQSEWILKLGDWASNTHSTFGYVTRPSDFMLNHIRAFANADQKNSYKWMEVHNKIQVIVNKQYKTGSSQTTGLMPDFMYKDSTGKYIPAKGKILESKNDGDYFYNACRTPWRLSMDYITVGDRGIIDQLTAINQWIKAKTGKNPNKITAGYYITNGNEGESIASYQDMCFIAPFAVSAMIDKSNQEWLNSLWDYIVKNNVEPRSYYNDSIKLMVMIVVSGKWQMP